MSSSRMQLGPVALCLALVSAVAEVPETPPAPVRFQSAIDAFVRADETAPPPKHAVLFVGSSIFRQWNDIDRVMAPLPAFNRAFGGSRTQDQLDRFDQVVQPHDPRIIVYYCGSNDLKAGDPPEAVFERFRRFSELVRVRFPETHLLFVSSTRSPDRRDKWDRVDRYNALVRAYCEATPRHRFIDVNPALVDDAGEPRMDLYREDRLHLQSAAYDLLAALVKPVVEKAWNEDPAEVSSGSPSAAFLPLALPAGNALWSDPPAAWTVRRIYAGAT